MLPLLCAVQLVTWMKTQSGIIDKMVNHIGLYSIMELLIMIGWDDGLGQVNDTQVCALRCS